MDKNKIFAMIGILALLLLGGGLLLANQKDETPAETSSTSEHSDTEDTTANHSETTTPPASETDTETEAPQANSVSIQNSAYSPASITVKKGTTVTWTNKDSIQHDVMPDNPSDAFPGSNGLLSENETYSFTFNTAGTYTYHCTPHPFMKGTVTVTE